MTRGEIGCCGAYCKTCRALADGTCRGCKLGYDNGERDLARARCQMKFCCLTRFGSEATCADCADYASCPLLSAFYGHSSYKYRKYHEALEFIRQHGYGAFLAAASGWRGAYGKLVPPAG
ncbi:DUF3795 domain-containing protein [bacterium]|nr:DUF3795 domain-containing protein [bacterium]